jgi:hypothetical protein
MGILRDRQELVELLQVRPGHTHVAHDLRLLRLGQRRRHDIRHGAAQPQHDRLDVETGRGAAVLDDTLHLGDGVQVEQLQHAGVLLDAAAATVLSLQGGAEFVEECRQVPAAKDIRMIQRCRPALQGLQVMPWIEHLLMPAVAARVRGDDVGAVHHVDAVDVDLDGNVLECDRARHAVAIGVDADGLIFVHADGLT